MVELALALQLLGSPAPALRVNVVAPLTLTSTPAEAPGRPSAAAVGPDAPGGPSLDGAAAGAELQPAPAPQEPDRIGAARRPVRVGTVAGASLGILVGDVVSAIPLVIGVLQCVEDLSSYGSTGGCARGATLMIVGAVALAVVPPAAGVLGARAAGERGDARGKAYLLALGVRLGAFALASALPREVQSAAVLGSELVLTPYVIARVLAGAPLPEPVRSPAGDALPVRDPAGAPGR